MGAVNPIPNGRPTLTPYVIVNGAAKAIAFYTQASARRRCSA